MLNENIKRIREKKGMTQKQLADIVGISGAFMSLIEKGTNSPSEENLQKIANALGVSKAELYFKKIGPTTELIQLLTELTKKKKIKWDIKNTVKLGPDFSVIMYYSVFNNNEYILSPEELALDRTNYGLVVLDKNGNKHITAEWQEYSQDLKELYNAVELSVNGKSFIYDQIDELKKLLEEDKNASI